MLDDSNKTSKDRRESNASSLPTWLFVLPWSLSYAGGVNLTLRSLAAQFGGGGAFVPQLLIGSEEPDAVSSPRYQFVKPYCIDLHSPFSSEHRIRAFISFVYHFPDRCLRVLRIIRRENVSVINPHFPNLGSLMLLALKKLRLYRGKIILSFHLSDVDWALSTRGQERRLWRLLLRGADYIVIVSEHLAKGILELDPGVATKIRTIRNGVDFEAFCSTGQFQGEQTYAPDARYNILSIGAFVRRKGHDVLVQAFRQVLIRIPEAKLTIVGGTGPEVESIRDLVRSMGMGEQVRITENIPHELIPKLFSQAQLFVLASRGEGHPLAVIEAGAAGLPVVCTRAEGIRQLISDRATGRLVDVDDEAALAQAIIDLLTDPAEARELGLAFHEHVRDNLTWGHTCRSYIDLARSDLIPSAISTESGK
jgi:colanic acid/amylovoran biosynthesis glycosyltransferase